MINVLFFGPVADRVGAAVLQLEHRQGWSVKDLRGELAQRYPEAFDIACFTAVDGAHVRDLGRTLDDGSEVAFMAKFSGG
ncbi:MoaD/ThiS family protein [Propionivibrio soli]|uniref:MoaD/ThiS family protein n=1 Tax=Propionivibrio soli TaxID=2976531 RepID=UPI0021E75685|nr:MoaD/ThiS family protein [Propionivibrio soli]